MLGSPFTRLTAQSVNAAIRTCQIGVIVQLRHSFPQRSSVVFSPDSRARMYFNHAVEVRGDGLVQEASLLAWRRFSYQCAYRIWARQTLMNVRIDSARLLIR
jgi:hypothetical protein